MPDLLPCASAGPWPAAAPYPEQWHSDRLDLGAYLRRLRVSTPLAADGATLAALHRAHIAAIPFENLDVVLGRGISVELADVEGKLVSRSRGGYCYEHATLFGAALERMGFQVDRVLARTGDPLESPRPRSHLLLLVSSPSTGERWLADVGFGSGLLTPLALVADGPHRQGAWVYELVRRQSERDTAWRLREHDGSRWTTILTFTEEPAYAVDVEVANDNTSTSPRSPFTQRPIVVVKDEAQVQRLLGRVHTVETPGRPTQRRVLTDTELAGFLDDVFGGALSGEEVTAVVAGVPPHSGTAPAVPGLHDAAQPAGARADEEAR